MDSHEKELSILQSIHASPQDVSQRDLARIAGLSLGMTNAILKRLAAKGMLTIKKVNNRNIRYAVSPKGLEAISRKSYHYFKRTIRNVVYYKETLEELVREIGSRGFTGIVLVGKSDLDFIVEHLCLKTGMDYVKTEEEITPSVFKLYAETYLPDGESKEREPDVVFLQEVLMDKP